MYWNCLLEGHPGIKKRIEQTFTSPRTDAGLNADSMADAFNFMKGLAAAHPDVNLGTMLQSKIDGILHRIRS